MGVRARDRRGRALTVVNPGAILGPVLSDDRSYSLEVIERLLQGMPGVPRIGFNFVDVRDVADLQIRAMGAPEAGGERLIAVDRFLWMSEVAEVLRDRLGEAAAKVPRRAVPDLIVRGMGSSIPGCARSLASWARGVELSNEKAEALLGWSPRPVEETIVDCAQSLIGKGVVGASSQDSAG